MIDRCTRKKCREYVDYGGRGIRVDPRWRKYENFISDMGRAPAGYRLDRKDNNGNYDRDNCRWATQKTQMRNTRCNKLIDHNGETRPLAEWVEMLKLNYKRVWYRLSVGWSVSEAFGG